MGHSYDRAGDWVHHYLFAFWLAFGALATTVAIGIKQQTSYSPSRGAADRGEYRAQRNNC